jgi:hypothetical protein
MGRSTVQFREWAIFFLLPFGHSFAASRDAEYVVSIRRGGSIFSEMQRKEQKLRAGGLN